MTGLVLGSLLLAFFLGVLAVMIWRNARSKRVPGEVVYVLDDAVVYVLDFLGAASDLKERDVRRILEWEVHHLQMRARKGHRAGGTDIIAGGTDQAVEYIRQHAETKQQAVYSEEQIRSVLSGEAAYLVSIGAVGEVVT